MRRQYRSGPSSRRPAAVFAGIALALASVGCTPPVTLPAATLPAPGQPAESPEPTVSTSDASIVVLYYVQCRSCQVAYSTPSGMKAHELEGGREFRTVFNANRPGVAVTLQVTPDEGTAVNRARIRVGNATLAEARRGRTGDPVNLSAVIGQ